MEEGYRALAMGDYTQACSYHEEALLLGEVGAFQALINDYQEILDISASLETENTYYNDLLDFAVKVQQYGKIAEDLIRSGNIF